VKNAFRGHIRCETVQKRPLETNKNFYFLGAHKFSFVVEYNPTEGPILQQDFFIFAK
jgi:hypothetical protein